MTLAYLEEKILNSLSTAADVSCKIFILDAVNFVAKSWRAVKEATILNCYRKTVFFILSPSMDDDSSLVLYYTSRQPFASHNLLVRSNSHSLRRPFGGEKMGQWSRMWSAVCTCPHSQRRCCQPPPIGACSVQIYLSTYPRE